MNRRNFFKFLGKAAAATGLAVVVGLPEMLKPVIEDTWDRMTYNHTGYKIPAGFPDDVYPLSLRTDYTLIMPNGISVKEFIYSRLKQVAT